LFLGEADTDMIGQEMPTTSVLSMMAFGYRGSSFAAKVMKTKAD